MQHAICNCSDDIFCPHLLLHSSLPCIKLPCALCSWHLLDAEIVLRASTKCGEKILARCMHASVEVRTGSGVFILVHACIGVRACKFVSVHAGSQAEPRWTDREFDGAGEHQPSHSASAAGGALASPQKPQPAPAGPGGAKSAAHAAELSG